MTKRIVKIQGFDTKKKTRKHSVTPFSRPDGTVQWVNMIPTNQIGGLRSIRPLRDKVIVDQRFIAGNPDRYLTRPSRDD